MSEFREFFARAASHAADYREAVSADPEPAEHRLRGILARAVAPVPDAGIDSRSHHR